MSSGTYLAVIYATESLYESVVTTPEAWNEQGFADWANDALVDAADLPREAVRQIRRCLRVAQKLQTFWATSPRTVSDHDDWRSKVDIAMGPRAWRPLLDLARIGLDDAPTEELFLEVKDRFAVVNSERWMDGIDFESWAENS